jgi:hypothetical protein
VDVREFRSTDLDACRGLYAQLFEHHREVYADPTIGGDDPGGRSDAPQAVVRLCGERSQDVLT